MVYSEKEEPFWWGIALGAMATLLTVLAFARLLESQEPQIQMPQDVIAAYNQGIKDALKTNPAGAELEMACLELWGKKQ
jgi:hypothetical protein